MITVTGKQSGGWEQGIKTLQGRLEHSRIAGMVGYTHAVGAAFAHGIAGRFEVGGPGWSRSLGGNHNHPIMRDTERLMKSTAYAVRGDTVAVGTNVPYGPQLNGDKGAEFTINAKPGKWLTIPNATVLSASEVRHAQAWDFPDAKPMFHNPGGTSGWEGPGIYKKTAGRGFLRKLFSLVKRVKIKARPFMYPEPISMQVAQQAAEQYFHTGRSFIPVVGSAGGNADVGARKGGRP